MKNFRRMFVVCSVLLTVGCGQSGKEDKASPERITVVLAQPFGESEGLDWRLPPDARDEAIRIQGDIDVTILLPSGQSYTTLSKFTSVKRAEDIVTIVTVTPSATASSFDEVVKDLERLLEGFGGGDAETQAKLKQLRNTPGEWGPFGRVGLNTNIEEGIGVSAEIRPTAEEGKWFLSCSIASTKYYGPDAISRGPSPLDSP